jgi:SP family general alpha glucoside:H+ symporter-like MFS transporter
MSSIKEKDEHGAHIDVQHSEVLVNQDLMNDALDGENREHEMGVWAAVKKHPWACFWAFTMCFTIVSLLSALRNDYS